MKKKSKVQNFSFTKNAVKNVVLKAMAVVAVGVGLFSIPSFTPPAQDIDILLKGGHVVDAKNNIDGVMDVAITGGKIFKVAANIPENTAKKVINVKGLYVSPGFIDLHTHVFVGPGSGFANGASSVKPDDFGPRSGVTTVVDAGSTGWKNFAQFKEQVVDRNPKTRVLSFINAFGDGMTVGTGTENDMDPQGIADAVKKYPDIIVGVCVGHYGNGQWPVFEKAEQDAKDLNMPLFVECHLTNMSLEGQLSRMRAGDILTHCFENVKERTNLVDDNGKIQPYVLDAQKRGVLFDLGHGGAGFWFNQGIPAVKAGFYPTSFGSDLHYNSVNAGMQDMLNSMSKFLNMGMSLKDVLSTASWKSASSIKREDLGNLSVGSVADIAVVAVRKGNFGFVDAGNFKLDGKQKLEEQLTFRAGRVVWDANGLAATTAWDKPLPASASSKPVNRAN